MCILHCIALHCIALKCILKCVTGRGYSGTPRSGLASTPSTSCRDFPHFHTNTLSTITIISLSILTSNFHPIWIPNPLFSIRISIIPIWEAVPSVWKPVIIVTADVQLYQYTKCINLQNIAIYQIYQCWYWYHHRPGWSSLCNYGVVA